MRKRIFLVCNFILASAIVFGQKNAGEIFYQSKFPSFTKDSIVFIGKLTFVEDKSIFTYFKYDLVDSFKSFNSTVFYPKSGAIIYSSKYDSIGSKIFRNYTNKTVILRISQLKPFTSYLVKDNWLDIDWEIMNEYKYILGFRCQKAIGRFRGRKYEAWYAISIPTQIGPWKLFGLPGAILEATDSTKMVSFLASSICYPCDSIQNRLKRPKGKISKNIQEYVHFCDYLNENFRDTLQAKAPKGIHVKLLNSTDKNQIQLHRSFKPEILYEWERDKTNKRPLRNNVIIRKD